jgi:hypothetical protein
MQTKIKNRIHAELTKCDRSLLGSLGVDTVSKLLPVIEALDQKAGNISAILKRAAKEDGCASSSSPRSQGRTTIWRSSSWPRSATSTVYPTRRSSGYASLVSSVRRNGCSTVYSHITKEGGRWVRRVLTEAVHPCLRIYTELLRFHKWLALRKSAQVAATATVKKMLNAIYCMLKAEEPFQP